MYKKISIIALIFCSYFAVHSMNRPTNTTYDHGFSDQDCSAMNKNPDIMIEHIRKAQQNCLTDGFAGTAVFTFNQDDTQPGVFMGLITSLADNSFEVIKTGNYVYCPHGLRYVRGHVGILLLGTNNPAKIEDALISFYDQYTLSNNLDAKAQWVAEAEMKNAGYFILRTFGIQAF